MGPYSYVGDDFTGSSDVLLQYIRAGMSGVLFLAPPTREALAEAAEQYATVGIATVARSLAPVEATLIVDQAFRSLNEISPRLVQYKVCSTGDSSPSRGSIAPAVEVGRRLFGQEPTPILIAQPGLGRYTVFGNHFARSSDGLVQRLDRHPMSRHPSTPMREADLRLHFALQLGYELGLLDLVSLREGRASEVIRGFEETGVLGYVVDTVDEEDARRAVGAILAKNPGTAFAVGSGGLSAGVGPTKSQGSQPAGLVHGDRQGRCLAVSGSASVQTSMQISRAEESGWHVIRVPSSLLAGSGNNGAEIGELCSAVAKALVHDRGVVVCTAWGEPTHARPVDPRRVGEILGEVIRYCREATELPRVVIAGGDTSGYVLRHLGATELRGRGTVGSDLLLGAISAEDPVLDGLEVVLKGGQLGGADVFEDSRTSGGNIDLKSAHI